MATKNLIKTYREKRGYGGVDQFERKYTTRQERRAASKFCNRSTLNSESTDCFQMRFESF